MLLLDLEGFEDINDTFGHSYGDALLRQPRVVRPAHPDRLSLLGDLRRTLEDPEQLQLHYPPKVALALGTLVGVEALLRWHHPERGPVPPGKLIAAAEGTGLVHPLTFHVLDPALAQARRWQDEDLWSPMVVSLNARSLQDLSLPGDIAALLARYDVPGASLSASSAATSRRAISSAGRCRRRTWPAGCRTSRAAGRPAVRGPTADRPSGPSPGSAAAAVDNRGSGLARS